MANKDPRDPQPGGKHPEFSSSEPAAMAARPVAPVESGVALSGRRVAVIVADGFEQDEFQVPVQRLRGVGAQVDVLAQDKTHLHHIKGERGGEPAAGTQGDYTIGDADANDYDALLIPGGLKSPDTMRQSPAYLEFVRKFVKSGKPIAAICHGPWLLADVDALDGRTVTSWPAIRRDLEHAGAHWIDQNVVQDGTMVFSRRPADAEAFAEAFIHEIAAHRAQNR